MHRRLLQLRKEPESLRPLVDEVQVVPAVSINCEVEGSGPGLNSHGVLEVFSYFGEAWGDYEGSTFLFFDIEVVIVAGYQHVCISDTFMGASHGLFRPPCPDSLRGVCSCFAEVSVGKSDDVACEFDT